MALLVPPHKMEAIIKGGAKTALTGVNKHAVAAMPKLPLTKPTLLLPMPTLFLSDF